MTFEARNATRLLEERATKYLALMFTRTDSSSLRGGCLLDLDVEPSQIL
jgi:hypothetical protein